MKFRETIERFQKHLHEGSRLVCAFRLTFICLHILHSGLHFTWAHRVSPQPKVYFCFFLFWCVRYEVVAPARGHNDGRDYGHYAKSTVVNIHLSFTSIVCEQRVKWSICIRQWWKFTFRLRVELNVCQISLKGRWHDFKSHTFEFYLSLTRCSLFTLHLIPMQKCHILTMAAEVNI